MPTWSAWGVVFACIALAESASLPAIRVDRESQDFVDAHQRITEFRGLNAVFKLPPYHPILDKFDPEKSLTEGDAANLRSWGFNVLRLGVTWESVAPAPGVFNTTYLGIMRDIVDRLARAGVYTIVDAHQDAFSRQTCGEGFPTWAVDVPDAVARGPLLRFPNPFPFDIPTDPETGMPVLSACQKHQFFSYYLSFAGAAAWGGFYANATLQREFAAHWATVAKELGRGRTGGAVLAFELLNEPWAGNIWRDPLAALVAGDADRKYLAPLYRDLHAAIRAVDDDTIVMYEPSVTESYLGQGTGFSEGPGGAPYDDRQAFAYHIYCAAQNSSGDPTSPTVCQDSVRPLWERSEQDWKALGGGAFLTEFGAMGPHKQSAGFISFMLDEAERRGQSWAYWTWKSFDDITTQNGATESLYNADGSLQTEKLHALSRTWAPAVAGLPGTKSQRFNSATGAYNLTYAVNPACGDAPTEIYVAADYYPHGFAVTVIPAGAAAVVDAGDGRKAVQHSAATMARAEQEQVFLTVLILPAVHK